MGDSVGLEHGTYSGDDMVIPQGCVKMDCTSVVADEWHWDWTRKDSLKTNQITHFSSFSHALSHTHIHLRLHFGGEIKNWKREKKGKKRANNLTVKENNNTHTDESCSYEIRFIQRRNVLKEPINTHFLLHSSSIITIESEWTVNYHFMRNFLRMIESI